LQRCCFRSFSNAFSIKSRFFSIRIKHVTQSVSAGLINFTKRLLRFLELNTIENERDHVLRQITKKKIQTVLEDPKKFSPTEFLSFKLD
jgi:hypothetical protein